MEVNISDFDLFILTEMFNSYKNNLDCNTWEITKKYCNPFMQLDSRKYKRLLDKHYHQIKSIIPKLIDYGLVVVKEKIGNKEVYTLNLSNFKIRKHQFQRKEFNCIALKIKNKWLIIETE